MVLALKSISLFVAVSVWLVAGPFAARAQEIPCSNAEQTIAQSTVPKVQSALDKAIAAIDRGDDDDLKKLKRWLGATSATEFKNIRATLVRARVYANGVSFLCAVNTNAKLGDIYARVKAGNPFTVVLASFFFSAADTGFDSKLGVIVHEFTHFILVGATKDKAYGTDEARTLASANPAQAQSNADNYEYFVESIEFDL